MRKPQPEIISLDDGTFLHPSDERVLVGFMSPQSPILHVCSGFKVKEVQAFLPKELR